MNRRQIRKSCVPMLMVPIVALAAFLLLLAAPVHADTLTVTDDSYVDVPNAYRFGSQSHRENNK